MNLVMLSASCVFVLLGAAFFVVFRQLASRGPAPSSEDWENIFAPSRYKPMDRLLDPADYRFLESQGVCDRGLTRRVRANRVRIFRGYARCLARDFTRVSSAIRMFMIQAPADRSALAGLILKQRLLFSTNMLSLQFRLTLHSFGWSAPTVDVRNLVEALDTMRIQLRSLALAEQPSAA